MTRLLHSPLVLWPRKALTHCNVPGPGWQPCHGGKFCIVCHRIMYVKSGHSSLIPSEIPTVSRMDQEPLPLCLLNAWMKGAGSSGTV